MSDTTFTATVEVLDTHFGPSAWNSKGHFFAIEYPNTLYSSVDGRPKNASPIHQFEKKHSDARTLFIDKDDNLYVSFFGPRSKLGTRTYRSSDGGKTFIPLFNWFTWGIDQDTAGHLYAGLYQERDSDCGCTIYKSIDNGKNWINIAPFKWGKQHHVHGLSVDPKTGWLYASLGDFDGLDGCWRSKSISTKLLSPALAGSDFITVEDLNGITVGTVITIHDNKIWEKRTVSEIDGNTIRFKKPILYSYDFHFGTYLLLDDWVNKFSAFENSQQYINILFKDGYVYLADDNFPKKHGTRTVVFRAIDDGGNEPVTPEPVLSAETGIGWGAYYMQQAVNGTIWVAVIPFGGKGAVWASADGINYVEMYFSDEEPDRQTRVKNRTFRDGTYGSTGYGTNLSSPTGQVIIPYKDKALLFSPQDK